MVFVCEVCLKHFLQNYLRSEINTQISIQTPDSSSLLLCGSESTIFATDLSSGRPAVQLAADGGDEHAGAEGGGGGGLGLEGVGAVGLRLGGRGLQQPRRGGAQGGRAALQQPSVRQ